MTKNRKNKFYLLVAGTRTFNDYGLLSSEIKRLTSRYNNDICIVSGGARGADALAKRYAEDNGLEYLEFKAEWYKYGKSAGPIRNKEMHQFISKFDNRGCVLFWDGKSKGTKYNIELSRKYNNQLRIVEYKDET